MPPSAPSTTLSTSTTQAPVSSTTSSAPSATTTGGGGGCTAKQWEQCAGINYSGCTTCAAPYSCNYINDYYSQCY